MKTFLVGAASAALILSGCAKGCAEADDCGQVFKLQWTIPTDEVWAPPPVMPGADDKIPPPP